MATAVADIPRLISYQGRLTDVSGNPVADGSYQVRFRIYDASSGGSTLWDNGSVSVTVTNGVFSYILGGSTALPANLFDNSAVRWLGITVGAGTEITPRTQLVSSAYAFHAKSADTASYALAGAGGSSGGWVDGGTNVYLGATGDSVGIGTTDPAAPLEVVAAGNAIVGHSTGAGAGVGVIGGSDGTGYGVYGSTNTGRGVFGTAYNGYGGYFTGAKNYFSQNLGSGTENPEEMLHVYRSTSGADAYLQLESDHASNYGEAGIRFSNPDGSWRLFMDDKSNDELPGGGFGLYSWLVAPPVMSFSNLGRVGFGCHSYSSYQVTASGDPDAFYASVTRDGIAYHASVTAGYGAYMEAPQNYFSGNTGFGTTTPTHRVTVNGALAIQQSGTTKYHVDHYNGGLNICETSVADYRFFIKDGGNVGIGTSNPTAKLHVNGTGTIGGNLTVSGTLTASDFANSSIGRADIIDEVGIASTTASDWLVVLGSGEYHPYLTRVIEVPTAGYILAIGSAVVFVDHSSGDNATIYVGVSADSTSGSGSMPARFSLNDECETGIYYSTLPTQRLFHVAAAGTYTYYMVVANPDELCWIGGRKLDLIFIPTSYSAKDGQLAEMGEEVLNPTVDPTLVPQPNSTRTAPARSQTAERGNLDAIATRVEQLTAELALLKEQLQQAQRK